MIQQLHTTKINFSCLRLKWNRDIIMACNNRFDGQFYVINFVCIQARNDTTKTMKLNESHKVNGTINAVSRTQTKHNKPMTRTKENERQREIKREQRK